MNKQEFYASLPQIAKRLFTLGIAGAILFEVIWRFGGYNLYGHFLDAVLGVVAFPMDLAYRGADLLTRATLAYGVVLGGKTLEISFELNQLESNMIVLSTFLAAWPHRRLRGFLKMAGLVMLFLVAYQAFSIVVQVYLAKIGPDMANAAEVFWEDTFWYRAIRKIAAFDKFILRYFAWLPIFLAALATIYFTETKADKKAAST